MYKHRGDFLKLFGQKILLLSFQNRELLVIVGLKFFNLFLFLQLQLIHTSMTLKKYTVYDMYNVMLLLL